MRKRIVGLVTAVATAAAAVAIIVLSGSCSPHDQADAPYAEQIRALEEADVEAEVAAAVSSGDLRFVAVMGEGRLVPGVPNYESRHAGRYGLRVIPNTGDVIVSEAHGRLQGVAWDYAERYNKLMLAHVVSMASKAPPSDSAPEGGAPVVVLSTSMGDIVIELYPDEAPITVENFLAYVDDGFFDGTIFHRVIPGFMIQGGGFMPGLTKKSTRPPIKNEAKNGLKNLRGTLSMARTADINSATSQFFLSVADNAMLDHGVRDFGYAVFAKVVEGMDVADKIVAVKTTTKGGHSDVPVDPVVIVSARRREAPSE